MEIAERSAIASGFSLSEIGTGGGSGLKTGGLAGGGGGRYAGMLGTSWVDCIGDKGGGMILGSPVSRSTGCANTGVTGEYGGRGGVPGDSRWLWRFSSGAVSMIW